MGLELVAVWACLCRVVSAPKRMVHPLHVIMKLNVRKTFGSWCDVMMGSCYSNLVRLLSFCVVLLVTSILISVLVIRYVTATSTLVYIRMPVGLLKVA